VIYLDVAGQKIVYLNTFKAAIELLEKRSSLYSDRPQSSMMQLMGIERILTLMRYGNEWRLGRRIFHQDFNSTTAAHFQDTQMKYTLGMLGLIRDDPHSFDKHYKYFSSGIILEALYGFGVKPIDDPYVIAVEKGMEDLTKGLLPGAFLVDAFPILKHVPEWFPGAGFKRNAREWGNAFLTCFSEPFAEISQSFEEGTANPSFATSWLTRISNKTTDPDYRDYFVKLVEITAGTAFTAGYETTSSTLLNFTLYAIQDPEVQRKAHGELDRVIGRERLPDFSDKDSLPFIDAIYKESLRIHPVLPFSLPHAVTTDDQYRGMHIPKASIIYPNVWAMSRDEKEYGPDVDAFRPDRFLEADVRDPASYVFGFGRRICPGRYMAENSVFIAICCILHIFSITRKTNEDGSEVPLDPEWINALVTHLAPFPASFKPRFEGAERLIQAA